MYRKYVKRLLDIILSAVALIIFSPLFVALMLLIALFLGHPIFFKQLRSGKNEKDFYIIKFRTMNEAKDELGNYLPDELRVTKFGKFLRSTSLDELPELINILSGDMSIIGPRPLPKLYNNYYLEKEKTRFLVRGGLVPPDSVNTSPIITWDEQFEYETLYATNLSFKTDLKILIGSVRILVKRNKNDYGSFVRKPLNIERIHMIKIEIVNRALEQYGLPIYIFEESKFISNYNKLINSFKDEYQNFNVGYSYKTNYTPYICKLVKEQGGYAEVVSDMEYELAIKLGYDNSKIIYNGPCKGEKLEEHILNGGICNIDNYDEAVRIANIANSSDKMIRVGIRLNLDIDAGYISRFGIEEDSEEMDRTVQILHEHKNISVVGLHCHISRARGLEAWKKRIEHLLRNADKYIQGIPSYIDVGSGMFGEMDNNLAEQFDMHIPSYSEYAFVVARAMREHYGTNQTAPLLLSEPGTTLIAKYILLIAKVDNIKYIRGENFATVDISYYNTGEICMMKKLPHFVLRNGKIVEEKSKIKTNIMGYTCLEQDCLYKDFDIEIETGDIIVFENVGGYSVVSKPPFIQPNCLMISNAIDGEMHIIKKAETIEEIFSTFIF